MAADIPSVPVTGTWHRHVPPGADPLALRQPAPDGRWQRGSEIAGLYLAQDEPTAWAEWYRALAEIGEPPDSRLPRDLWRIAVDATPVADMTGAAALRALGLPDPVPERAQWPAFQAAGTRLAASGYAGILFRSTARPNGLCLCVFARAGAFPGVSAPAQPERITAAPTPPRGMRT
jgi:RES domain-containing protein